MAPKCFVCGQARTQRNPVFLCPTTGDDFVLWSTKLPTLAQRVNLKPLICSRHFEKEYIARVRCGNKSTYALLADAVPSVAIKTEKKPDFVPDSKSKICADHFAADQFTATYGMFWSGFADRVIPQKSAVPSMVINTSSKNVVKNLHLRQNSYENLTAEQSGDGAKRGHQLRIEALRKQATSAGSIKNCPKQIQGEGKVVSVRIQEHIADEEPLITLPSLSVSTLEQSDDEEEADSRQQEQRQQLKKKQQTLEPHQTLNKQQQTLEQQQTSEQHQTIKQQQHQQTLEQLGQSLEQQQKQQTREHQRQSISDLMVQATRRYLETPDNADVESPMKELVIKLEPCDILVSGQFTDNPTSPPSKVYKAQRRRPVTPRVAPIMYECEVLDCGFRTPRPAILEHHMTYHPIDCVLRPASDRIEEQEMDIPVKVVANAVKRKANESKAKSKSRAAVPKVPSPTESSAAIISHQDHTYHLESHELSAQLPSPSPPPGDTTHLELIESPLTADQADDQSGDQQTAGTKATSEINTTNLASGLNPEQTAALKELYAADRNPESEELVFDEGESLMDDSETETEPEPAPDSEYNPESTSDSDLSVDSDQDYEPAPKKKQKKKKNGPVYYGPPVLHKCTECDFTCKGRDTFRLHMYGHRGIFYECKEPGCEYKTTRRYGLKKHWKFAHSPEFKAVLCEICGKEVRHLKSHIYSQHTQRDESKILKCKSCDFKSHSSIHMQRHERIHSGDKPYKCTQCNYSSNQKTNLNTHMRTHTGDKPYKCPSCDYTAAHNVTLKGHIKAQHPE